MLRGRRSTSIAEADIARDMAGRDIGAGVNVGAEGIAGVAGARNARHIHLQDVAAHAGHAIAAQI